MPSVRRRVERELGLRLPGGATSAEERHEHDDDHQRPSRAARRDGLRRRGRSAGTFRSSRRRVYGKPLVYLDNAATTQKPLAVIDAERDVYESLYANIHRGVHLLSVRRDRRLRAGAREGRGPS